jgi:TolB protein
MDIFTASADGSAIRHFVVQKENVETDPAWSSDGAQLALTSGAAGRPGIHIVGGGGGKPTRIVTGYGYTVEPTWNPVFKSKIAFTFSEGGQYKIGVIDTATGKVEPVATAGNYNFKNPVWCADGRHIVATRETGRATRLVLVDTSSSRKPAKVTLLSGVQMANCSESDYFFSQH